VLRAREQFLGRFGSRANQTSPLAYRYCIVEFPVSRHTGKRLLLVPIIKSRENSHKLKGAMLHPNRKYKF
jgi:hypothetical protein